MSNYSSSLTDPRKKVKARRTLPFEDSSPRPETSTVLRTQTLGRSFGKSSSRPKSSPRPESFVGFPGQNIIPDDLVSRKIRIGESGKVIKNINPDDLMFRKIRFGDSGKVIKVLETMFLNY
ncbi:uncharacterized protein [Amphiura filiformis]|uniref:uncharacterized protein n=1 Tax=Amphiura filiformis TaxID=82378 RepID=UPI003B22301D